MRLTYVIDSLHQGGAERSLVEILPEYQRLGIETTVIPLKRGGPLERDAEAAGASVHHVTATTRSRQVVALRAVLARTRPDIVHTTLFEADVVGRTAAALAQLPVVTSLVNDTYGPEHRADPALRRTRVLAAQTADVATARFARLFHANAAHVADTMARRLLVPRTKVVVIPRGRSGHRLERDPAAGRALRAELGVSPRLPMLLALGRHERQKGLDVAIRALSSMRTTPPPLLCIAGREGTETAMLRGLIEQLGLGRRVRLLGYRADVGPLLAAADILVLTSRREGLPGVLIEALGASVPIAATDLPGVREVLGPVRAPLVRVDDDLDLADTLDRLLADEARRRELALAGRERFVRHFDLRSVAGAMASFYERAMG